ncbi:MAG: glycosyltransferase family 39 protein [bacterium]
MSALMLWFAVNLLLLGIGRRHGLREAFCAALISLFLVIAVSTEGLSLCHALSFQALSVLWTALAGLSAFLVWRLTDRTTFREATATFAVKVRGLPLVASLGLALIALILGTTLVVALFSPPNTWDSMTYHMARVAEWIQSGSVQFYPTANERQNYQLPLAGFAVLHLQLLTRSDLLANIPQWICFAACIILVSLIVKELGQPLSVQIFGGLTAATLPEAILQASSTQTDLICGAFCLAFAFFLGRLTREATPRHAVYAGLSLGLALLSKGTAYLYVGAIGLALGVPYLVRARHRSRSAVAGDITWIVLLVFVLNIGHWSRSYDLYRQPLASGTESYANDRLSLPAVWANLVRNTALHLGVPAPAVNQGTTTAIRRLLGGQADNPETTWPGTRFGVGFSTHEDTAGNGLHLLLIVMALLSMGWIGKAEQRTLLLAWAGAILLGAVFFCAYLKWQPWNGRLHTPLFMLALPLVAARMAEIWGDRTRFPLALACLLGVAAMPFLLQNATRPLLPLNGVSVVTSDRMQSTLRARPDLRVAYPAAVREALRGHPPEVGLMLGNDDWEYPLWVLGEKSAVRRPPAFRHVVVANLTRELAPVRPLPDVIISTRPLERAAIAAHGYTIASECGVVRVLRRMPPPN